METLKLEQGTEEWLEHRKNFCNASEAGAVMECNPWFPKNKKELCELKAGLKEVKTTPAMEHGHLLEPIARERAEAAFDEIFEPLTMTDDRYSASLDGINLNGDIILEIKCPYSGIKSKVWQEAQIGKVSEHYYWQVQQQLMVSGATHCIFMVFVENVGISYVEVEPNEFDQKRLCQAWTEFEAMMKDEEFIDSLSIDERDDDKDFLNAAQAYKQALEDFEKIKAVTEARKKELIDKCSKLKTVGGGLSVTKTQRVGAVDYKKIPELKDIDLNKYRKPSTETITVRLDKD